MEYYCASENRRKPVYVTFYLIFTKGRLLLFQGSVFLRAIVHVLGKYTAKTYSQK